MSLSSVFGFIGILMAIKKVEGAPLFTAIAGILIFAMIAQSKTWDVGYSDAQPANTTQTGGIISCQTVSNTTCTPQAIHKSFSYFNSTGQLTSAPDPIPVKYAINQENAWVLFLFLAVMWMVLSISIQWAKW
jgi:hypothetical protein